MHGKLYNRYRKNKMKRKTKRSLYTYRQDHSDLINFLKQFDNEKKDSTTNNKTPKSSNS